MEKGEGLLPAPSELRPIDIFPIIVRIMSSACVNAGKPWTLKVLHPDQCASSGGTPKALQGLNLHTETCLHDFEPRFGVSLDFTKLFNTLCPDLVMNTAALMGLNESMIRAMFLPIKHSQGAWRLPQNFVVPLQKRGRGLPQGLSASVLASELVISLLVWKIDRLVRKWAVCYVDDLNFTTKDAETLVHILRIIFRFVEDLKVNLSCAKSCLWGTDRNALHAISREWGVPVADSFTTLGVEWSTNSMASPVYKKETQRIKEAELRLARLQHLPSSLSVKEHVASVGILTLLDYHPSPCVSLYLPLRSQVKRVFNCVHGAPEIVLNILLDVSLDPEIRWELALFKILSATLSEPAGRELLSCLRINRKHGRLAAVLRLIKKRGWTLHEGVLETPTRVNLRLPWESIRKRVNGVLIEFHCRRLAEKRPRLYAGIQALQPKQHRKLLKGMTPYSAATLLRIWAGSVLTKAHKNTIDATQDPACGCGAESQTIDHLLYHFPMVEQPDPPDNCLGREMPSRVSCFVVPTLDQSALAVWRKVCFRAVSVVSSAPAPSPKVDWKGHIPHHDAFGIHLLHQMLCHEKAI